jgi:hypothetical protein
MCHWEFEYDEVTGMMEIRDLMRWSLDNLTKQTLWPICQNKSQLYDSM